MHKINHFFTTIIEKSKQFTLTIPVAIILGSVIIAVGIMGYGLIISGSSTRSSVLAKIVKEAGINAKAFNTCVTNNDTTQDVATSLDDGMRAGVEGTPTTFIIKVLNGTPHVAATISGAQTLDYFSKAVNQAIATTDTKLPIFEGKPVEPQEIEGGTAVSDVYIVEYSDAECPYCIRAHTTIKQLRTTYAGKASFVYRNFPLISIHQHAQKEAEMISCAYKLGGHKALYKYIDASFDYKVKNNVGFLPPLEN